MNPKINWRGVWSELYKFHLENWYGELFEFGNDIIDRKIKRKIQSLVEKELYDVKGQYGRQK